MEFVFLGEIVPRKLKEPKIIDGIVHWKCSSCHEWKRHYHKNASTRNGLNWYCITCQRIYNRKHARNMKGRALENRRKYIKGYMRAYRVDPLKVSCRSRLNYEIRWGRIKRPEICEHCKERKRITAHHEDYNKPLDVMWLCYLCHAAIERKENYVN